MKFTIKSLLVITALLGLGLGVCVHQAERKKHLIALVRQGGGTWPPEFKHVTFKVERLNLSKFDQGIGALSDLSGIGSIYIHPDLSDGTILRLKTKHLVALGEMSELESLQIHGKGTRLTPDMLQGLARSSSLGSLILYNCGISDEGVKVLAEIESLHTLELVANPITNEAVDHLDNHPNMSRIGLEATEVTGHRERQYRRENPEVAFFL